MMNKHFKGILRLLLMVIIIAAFVYPLIPKVGGVHGYQKWTRGQQRTYEQMRNLRDTIRTTYDIEQSGNRYKKYWYKSIKIPPEVIIADYGESHPALALLENNSNQRNQSIPVLYKIADDKPNWAVALYGGSFMAVRSLPLAWLNEQIEAARAEFAAKDADAEAAKGAKSGSPDGAK